MTRGAQAKFADTPLAEWIHAELVERGWQKQDLAARLREASGGRLARSGAERLVIRATSGAKISEKNLQLFAQVLGEPGAAVDGKPSSPVHRRLEELATALAASMEGQARLNRKILTLQARVRKLEARDGLLQAGATGRRHP